MAGEVVHVEFPAADVDRAQRFWSAVFGWSFADSGMPGMDYRMARVGDNAGAALMPGETGHPNFYFDTEDIDALSQKYRGRDYDPSIITSERVILRIAPDVQRVR